MNNVYQYTKMLNIGNLNNTALTLLRPGWFINVNKEFSLRLRLMEIGGGIWPQVNP